MINSLTMLLTSCSGAILCVLHSMQPFKQSISTAKAMKKNVRMNQKIPQFVEKQDSGLTFEKF